MGFRVGRTFTLEFDGTDLDGAEVKFRSASIGALQEIRGAEGIEEEAALVAPYLVSWNLEDESGSLPADAKGLLALEEPAYRLIVSEWLKATRGVTAPLDHRSSGGERSREPESESIPMETR
jgi:hypothetical protein